MRILLSKPDHAKHIGKRLSRELEVPLTRGYVLAANILGYSSWDDFLSECNWSPGCSDLRAAWPDSQCMPQAVLMRRAFQADVLARRANLAPERARTLVETIRPSDGFERPDLGGIASGLSPRQHDPKISAERHGRMSVELHRIWQFSGRRYRLAETLKRVAYALEGLQLGEWPSAQFGTSVHDSCYAARSPTFLDDLRRAPKWLSAENFQDARRVLGLIAQEVAAAEILDMDADVARVVRACGRSDVLLCDWREASRPHDGEPLAFDGAPLIEDDALAMLRSQFADLGQDAYALSDPLCDEVKTRRLLSRIEAMPVALLSSEPMLFAVRRLKNGLRRFRQFYAQEARVRQPTARDWDLWAVDATGRVGCLGRLSAATSLDAIKAGPTYLHGRVVAVPAGAWPTSEPGLMRGPALMTTEVQA